MSFVKYSSRLDYPTIIILILKIITIHPSVGQVEATLADESERPAYVEGVKAFEREKLEENTKKWEATGKKRKASSSGSAVNAG